MSAPESEPASNIIATTDSNRSGSRPIASIIIVLTARFLISCWTAGTDMSAVSVAERALEFREPGIEHSVVLEPVGQRFDERECGGHRVGNAVPTDRVDH